MALGPNIISITSHKCVTRFEAAWHEFSRMGNVSPMQIDIETFHVSMVVWRSFQLMGNHVP